MGAVEDMKMDNRKRCFVGVRMSNSEREMLGKLCTVNNNSDVSETIRKLIRKEHNKFYSSNNETEE